MRLRRPGARPAAFLAFANRRHRRVPLHAQSLAPRRTVRERRPMTDISFSLQARPADRDSWVRLARRAEAEGFRALYCADHPGYGSSPFVSLAAAAAVTDRIDLGTYVSQAGAREPAHVLSDAAG